MIGVVIIEMSADWISGIQRSGSDEGRKRKKRQELP